MANKQGKMQNFLNYRMRATLNDGRQMAGQMMAFDKHMNLVLADTEEFRRVKRKAKSATSGAPGSASSSAPAVETEEKRTLGLTIVRGTNIVSLSVDGPPPADPSSRLGPGASGGAAGAGQAVLSAGPGVSKPAGRGMPTGLTGPATGVGGPGAGGFGGFPPAGFPGGAPGFPGRGGPPGGAPPGFPPQGFPGGPPGGPGAPPGFQPPQGFQPPGQGRGFPPGFNGR